MYRRSLWRTLSRCLVHLLAIMATIAISYFNLAGYYIGANLAGITDPTVQAFDILCLQIAAKIQVNMRDDLGWSHF